MAMDGESLEGALACGCLWLDGVRNPPVPGRGFAEAVVADEGVAPLPDPAGRLVTAREPPRGPNLFVFAAFASCWLDEVPEPPVSPSPVSADATPLPVVTAVMT
ncbi:hypothetical protein BOH72_19065 [Mycobacterium sp. WY10]|nr:hypothetical protein BOH72_19065 [Mycobacterium sp. WY10]